MSYIVDVNSSSSESVLWKAWMNTVHDYEKRVLKGKQYPPFKTLTKQKKAHYNFDIIDADMKIIKFASEKDFVCFLLKWG